MTVLDINIQENNARFELILKGRVDAFGSRNLEEEIKEQMKLGRHELILNFQAVDFLSSAGIRVFIKYYKELKAIGGALSVSQMSEMVTGVFNMAGLSKMIDRPNSGLTIDQKIENLKKETDHAVYYLIESAPDHKMSLATIGDAGKIRKGTYTEEDATLIRFPGKRYGIGLGALANSFVDAADRFGEMLAVGEAVIYLPTDGSKSVDYMEHSGRLVSEAMMLSAINFEGEFSKVVGFRAKQGQRHVGMDQLAKDFLDMGTSNAVGIVLVAETSGMVGCSLNVSPVRTARSPFTFPSIRDDVSFTIEPEHDGCMVVVTGIVHKGEEALKDFSTEIGDTGIYSHFHAAVFGFHPLQKNNTDLGAAISTLLSQDKLLDVLHLINDDRPVGSGQSCFTKGTCWIGSVHLN